MIIVNMLYLILDFKTNCLGCFGLGQGVQGQREGDLPPLRQAQRYVFNLLFIYSIAHSFKLSFITSNLS